MRERHTDIGASFDRWGESAGAISVALQMLANGGNTEGLFRGAFMQSGSPIPVGDVSHGQPSYDALVRETGCAGAGDTLQCLREVPFESLMAAVHASPGAVGRVCRQGFAGGALDCATYKRSLDTFIGTTDMAQLLLTWLSCY